MSVHTVEPLMPDSDRSGLADLTMEIARESGALSGSHIRPETATGIRTVIRQMNSYYSNLIEGHKTNPREVEKALKKDFDRDPKKKALQQLGVAHIETEECLEGMLDHEQDVDVYSTDFLQTIHREFYGRLPKELVIVKDSKGKVYPLNPGEIRTYNVDVGHHVPPDFQSLPAFMDRFHSFYSSKRIVTTRRLVAIAASHHRLLWIHPFGDGNGRVARFFSHLALAQSGLGGHGLWTLSRGLARNRESYYRHLQLADQGRLNDYDGRGNLSAEGLREFCTFFLETVLDQITFMTSALEYRELRHRIENYVFRNNVFGRHNEQGQHLLLAALHEGQYARGEATRITGFKETLARELLQTALDKGLLVSDGPRGPVRLGFPNEVLDDYFPKLFMPTV